MALTQNGSQTLAKSLFGYNYAATGVNPPSVSVTGCSITNTTVSLGSAQTWAVNSQVIVNVSGTVYVGLANAAGSSLTTLVVDAWYNQSTWGVTTSLSGSSLTVAIVAQPLGAYFLGLSGTSTSGVAMGTLTESTFGELTGNGLGRVKASTITWTPGSAPTGSANATGTMTLGYTWTYTGSTSQTLTALGVYFAPYASRSNNTLMFATAISSAPSVTTNGDQLVVTETISQS